MKNALLATGGILAGVWAYDQVAVHTSGNLPVVWSAIFGNPTLVNYAFDELWLLVVGMLLVFLALVM